MFTLQSLPDDLNASRDFPGSLSSISNGSADLVLCSYSIYNDFSRLLNHDCQILLNLPISHDDEVLNRFA